MSSENNKILLKQAEVAIQRFNNQAIPYHLGLLKNHKSNIEKNLALGNWLKIKKEEINAMRVIKQLKNLLLEMDALRSKVQDKDLERFDAMMEKGKAQALEGMKEYLELQLQSPAASNFYSEEDNDANSLDDLVRPVDIGSTPAHQITLPRIETDFEAQKHQLAQRQACLDELENLHREIGDLNCMFHNMHEIVHEQAASVTAIAENAEEAFEQVQQGERNLRRALVYKKAMYPVVGAMVGTCLGGPIGLIAGIKAGGLAAIGCGILGFTGGSVLKSNSTILQGNIEEQQQLEIEMVGDLVKKEK